MLDHLTCASHLATSDCINFMHFGKFQNFIQNLGNEIRNFDHVCVVCVYIYSHVALQRSQRSDSMTPAVCWKFFNINGGARTSHIHTYIRLPGAQAPKVHLTWLIAHECLR